MKKVFTSSNVTECDLIRSQLDSASITAILKNERGSMAVGVGYPIPNYPSVAFAWPEIWVHDEDEQDALSIIGASVSNISPEELEKEAMDPRNRSSETETSE